MLGDPQRVGIGGRWRASHGIAKGDRGTILPPVTFRMPVTKIKNGRRDVKCAGAVIIIFEHGTLKIIILVALNIQPPGPHIFTPRV